MKGVIHMNRRENDFISETELRKLVKKAKKGDNDARDAIVAQNKKMAKRSNTRIDALEKANLDYYAYDKATGYTLNAYNSRRFSTSKKKLADIEDFANNIRYAQEFLSKETSTIKGQKKVIQKRLDTFDKMGITFRDNDKKEDFLRFLGEEDIAKLIKTRNKYDSDQLVELIKGAYTDNRSVEKMRKIADDFNNEKLAYDELLDELEKMR